jgi:hypothetical protein
MGFPFSDYIALLEQFLSSRQAIVDGLERQLFGARGKANAHNGDRESIADIFNGCFFESPAISRHLSRLNGQLAAARLADGFEPARQDGYSRELDPVELVLRACHHWETTRWPGTHGRLVYAQSLYAVFMLGQLERLSLRFWDEGHHQAAERLQHVQRLLDLLNAGVGSAHEIRLVRDARWLIETAQGPLTRHVRPYFIKAGNISGLPDEVRLEIHRAGAVLAGGHLRSQLQHLSRRTGWAFDDPQLLALTRSSNSMDMALLVRDLVPLLDAYSAACARQDGDARLALADAILQGLSADPELLLTRLDLLGPSTMIEDLFVDRGDAGAATDTAMGEAHREYLARYGELVARTAEALQKDSAAFDPAHAAYSPLGVVYGFCSDLFSNMVLNTLRSPSLPDLSLEDVFNSRERLEEKQTQTHEWERLPKREHEPNPFEHSREWAAQMHARLAGALEARAARPAESNGSRFRKSCLYVVPRGVAIDSLSEGALPPGIVPAQEHCLTSDVTRSRRSGATLLPADRLIADRAEGRLLACVHSDGAWFGVSKVPLTLFTSQGKDALITDVPPGVIDVMRQACPELLVVIDAKL